MWQIVKENIKYPYILVGIFLLNVLAVDAFEYYTEKPDFFKSCKLYEPEFTKCSTESVQSIISHLWKGDFPEISQKLGPLDPMKLENIRFKPDNGQAVTLAADLNDVVAKGFSNMTIKESRVSKKDFSWLTKIFLPRVNLSGKYKMNGKVLLIPINGAGKFSVDIDNMDILMHSKTRLYEKGDFTFYNVTTVRVELDMTGMRVNFDRLFNGQNAEIERSTNQFFNENWRQFFEALRPIVTETVESLLLRILKETFNILPATFLIDDIPTSSQLYNKNYTS